jgi:hypothetical protein
MRYLPLPRDVPSMALITSSIRKSGVPYHRGQAILSLVASHEC